MIRKQSVSAPRWGFTLIELLVVIAIIAVLVSLISAAVIQVMQKIPETKTRTEIAQLEAALQSFSQDHNGVPLPSSLTLRDDGNYAASDPTGQFLRRAFGKNIGPIDWNQNGHTTDVITLTGQQCLVFYLGGPTGLHGFSNNNTNPTVGTGNPYYNFVPSRLDTTHYPAQFPAYQDAYGTGQVYAYFSTAFVAPGSAGLVGNYRTGDCPSPGAGISAAVPWVDSASGTAIPVNPNGYQILSAGHNGVFGGQGQSTATWNSQSGTLDANGKDDQANFSQRLLMAGLQ